MGISTGSWLSEQRHAYENFLEAKSEFNEIYVPLTNSRYEKERVWNSEKQSFFFHVIGEGEEFIITLKNMLDCRNNYKEKFENLRKENNKMPVLSPQTVNMYKTVLKELETMRDLIEDE